MVAKFKTLYFNAKQEDGDTVLLWTYKKPSWLKNFEKSYDDDCLLCYCREVDIDSLEKLLNVCFSVIWKNKEFVAEYIPQKGSIRLFSSNSDFAKELAFKKTSKGAEFFSKVVAMDEIEEFRVTECDLITNNTRIYVVDNEEFVGLWRLYISNLSFGKRRNKDLVKAFS